MERTMIKDLTSMEGKEVEIKGWVDTIREHGKLIFLEIRDITGTVQTLTTAKDEINFEIAKSLSKESSIRLTGEVKPRPEGTQNKNSLAGTVEIKISELEIYVKCPPLPFDINNEELNEDTRLKYRYLDLRRPEMQKNLILRSKIIRIIRDTLYEEGFNEFETPILAKSTPEGARDYVVPSRTQPGKFFALPQSPQLFKQLLMVAGFEKYFQIAKCMRDEDLRSDRQPEFTQLDVEMSFVSQEDIMALTEKLLKKIWKEILNIDIKIPFQKITYDESMKKYGIDRPDLRKNKDDPKEYAFCWVVDFPAFDKSEGKDKMIATHHPFTHPEMKSFNKDPLTAKSIAYDIVLNGTEIGGGSIRIHEADVQAKVFEVLGIGEKEQQEKFGFLLDALKFGAPPHGGIAWGLDRLVQIILGADSIRETIAFPKNKEARDLMTDAPSPLSTQQLKDVHIKIDITKKKNVFEEIINLLDKGKIKYKILEHKAVFTSEEAAKVRETKLEEAAKALILETNNGYILSCIRGTDTLNLTKVKKELKLEKVKRASAQGVKKVTGCSIGSISPFGNIFDLQTYFDKELSKNTNVVFNAGLHTKSILMKMKDLINITNAKIIDIKN